VCVAADSPSSLELNRFGFDWDKPQLVIDADGRHECFQLMVPVGSFAEDF